MTINGKPKRVPRKEKKRMGKGAYRILMRNENAIWRADIRLDFRVEPPKHIHYGHNIFIPLK